LLYLVVESPLACRPRAGSACRRARRRRLAPALGRRV